MLVLDKPGQGISDVTKNTLAFGVYLPNTLSTNGQGQDPDKKWETNFNLAVNGKQIEYGLFNVSQIEKLTGYDFFFNIPSKIQNAIEKESIKEILHGLAQRNIIKKSAFLMAASEEENLFPLAVRTNYNSTVGHSSFPNQIKETTNTVSQGTSISKVSISQDSIRKTTNIGFTKDSITSIHMIQVGSPQIDFSQITPTQVSGIQISIPHNSTIQPSTFQRNTKQVGFSQISPTQIGLSQIGSTQVDISQNSTFEVNRTIRRNAVGLNQLNSSKVSFPISITLQQLLSSNFPDHYLPSSLTNTFKDNPLNLTLEITDLPTGQLAEAVVTHYTDQGIPNGGKILIDHNANGLGWFIDTTPLDHSEFSQTLAETALLAAADSEAHGKYDLLTTILHKLGHLAGFISGYNEFDRHIQTINGEPVAVDGFPGISKLVNPEGKKTFVADNFTVTLSSDGSHLDPTVHPHDLMNTTLKPGVRKLPSLLNLQILNALKSEGVSEGILTAPLTSTPLLGINSGTFGTQDIWSTRGAANIIQGQAVLTEESRLNSNFTQDFIIPNEAKYLQFTILDAELDNSNLVPGDAFEVALLDTNTFTPLAGITSEFSQTDALLNIQHDGDTYFSDKVKLSDAPTVETITLTVNNVAPTVNAGDDQTAVENQEVPFNGSYTDPRILDTHTIEWDLGDGTVVENEPNPHLHNS